MKLRDAREVAVRVLRKRERALEFTEDILASEFAAADLSAQDRALVQEMAYGVVRWQALLDWLIQQKAGGRTQNPALRILLRLGLYQLFWLERVPDHAAVFETVAVAKRLGYGPQAGFINAVLRGFLRERPATERLLDELRPRDPALAYSHPGWLFARWEHRWGREQAIKLMDWNNQAPPTFARTNTLRIQPDQLRAQWDREGVAFSPVSKDWVPQGEVFELTHHPRLTQLPSFQNGGFYVQDPSTLLAVLQLDPQPGERVLDVCAAPGGKTAYIAQRMQDHGEIMAEDLWSDRLQSVRENCERLGIQSVQTRVAMQSSPAPVPNEFDRVLIDAPCSNTGVMRRRVDLRWRIQPREIERLRSAQRELLERAAGQLKPGGTLVYSTCSLEPEENRGVVDAFLAEHSDFRLQSERELLPFNDGVDGAYVARLTRV